MNALQIIKSSGNTEDFSIIKLKRSLIRSGLDEKRAESIAQRLKQKCSQGFSSKKLYRMAYNMVKKESRVIASKYSMTKAISELGPDGYHFEKFICALFEAKKYQAKTNYFAQGRCVRHEVDVKAEGEKNIFCECKFHNNPATKNDIKVALYVKARADDIRENPENNMDEFWLISNTKFSQDAIDYALCTGLKLLGPNAPHKQALSEMAVDLKVYPIGAVTNLKKKHLKILTKRNIILASQILENHQCLHDLNLSDELIQKILKEIKRLLK